MGGTMSVLSEKWRPQTIDECVIPEAIEEQIKGLVAQGNLPSLLFLGSAGVGKTTVARAIANEMGADLLFINASMEGNVDLIRTKLTQFASTISFTNAKKITILDECLDENTEVSIMRDGIKQNIRIADLDDESDLVKSFNFNTKKVEWLPFHLFEKDIRDDCLEICFEDGQSVICTPEHKWHVLDENNKIKVVITTELNKYKYIITTQQDYHVNSTKT